MKNIHEETQSYLKKRGIDMNREMLFEALDECVNDMITVTFYNYDEICGIFKMEILSVDEFDDEVILYGDRNQHVVIPLGNVDVIDDDDDVREFHVTTDSITYSIVF